MQDELSPTMDHALQLAREKGDGKLTRFPGGRWIAGTEYISNAQFGIVGTLTVEALVNRGKMTYTKWQEREPHPAFPIEATIV